MINQSRYWKESLLRAANWLERLRVEERTAERSLVRVERELFVGFYAVRKLLETFKISSNTRTLRFSLTWSPCIKMVDYMNAHRIDELFDLEVAQIEERNIEFLCNQFIHSYVFTSAQLEDGSLAGAYVSSDRTRKDKLYFVELAHILTAFRTVGKDYPIRQSMRRNENTHQWEVGGVNYLDRSASIILAGEARRF